MGLKAAVQVEVKVSRREKVIKVMCAWAVSYLKREERSGTILPLIETEPKGAEKSRS